MTAARRDDGTTHPATSAQGAARHALQLVRESVPPMHPAGRPFVAAGVAAALLLRLLWRPLGRLGLLAAAATALFFRSPRRVAPTRTGLAVAAADGTVAAVDDASPPPELGLGEAPLPRVSVFLSILDVHTQRCPVAGTVRRVAYRPGAFLSADLDKASEDNERNSVLLQTPEGQRVAVVQIAGLVARRIVCDLAEGQPVALGETYGLIRFGSRVEVFLPPGSRVLIAPGQRAVAGETAIAELPAPAAAGAR